MRRRLGRRRRRETWDYAELFSVTLLLIFWSVLYRALFTADIILARGDVHEGWLYGSGVPGLWATLLVVSSALVLTGGCLFDARNRTRNGYAISATNLAFAVFLGIALVNHTAFATAHAVAEAEGRRTFANLERDARGRWEVMERDEPEGSPRFPGEVLVMSDDSTARVSGRVDPLHVATWWHVVANDSVAVDLPAARWCGFMCFSGETTIFEIRGDPALAVVAPAIVVEVLSRNPPGVGDWIAHHAWAGEVPQPEPRELVLRSIAEGGGSTSTVRLKRIERRATGLDLGDELGPLREKRRFW